MMARFGFALLALLLLGVLAPGDTRAADGDGDGSRRIETAQLSETPFFRRLFGMERREPEGGGARILRVPADGQLPGVKDPAARTAPKRVKPPAPVPVKAPDARRILVIGDAFAATLGRGLDVAFADTPTVRIDVAALSPSGLADPGPADWRARVEAVLDEATPPALVVVMLGLDDGVPIPVDGAPAEFRSPSWEEVYRARVRGLVAAARSRQVPVYWMGLVPVADVTRTADLAYLDEIFRQEVAGSFGTYVDIWNEFASETGDFAVSGPDVGGQVRQLRLKDGVGFTRSGTRKLALYAEQAIRTWLSEGGAAVALPAAAAAEGLVVSLNDPQAGPDEELAGPGPAAMPEEGSLLFDLVVLGKPLLPIAGRVDDLATVE